jgi:hypothetical protein
MNHWLVTPLVFAFSIWITFCAAAWKAAKVHNQAKNVRMSLDIARRANRERSKVMRSSIQVVACLLQILREISAATGHVDSWNAKTPGNEGPRFTHRASAAQIATRGGAPDRRHDRQLQALPRHPSDRASLRCRPRFDAD